MSQKKSHESQVFIFIFLVEMGDRDNASPQSLTKRKNICIFVQKYKYCLKFLSKVKFGF